LSGETSFHESDYLGNLCYPCVHVNDIEVLSLSFVSNKFSILRNVNALVMFSKGMWTVKVLQENHPVLKLGTGQHGLTCILAIKWMLSSSLSPLLVFVFLY